MSARIVGRERERSQLSAFLEEQSPGALLIEGEAGVGKTMLWQDGLDSAGKLGLRVLVTRGAGAEVQLGYAGLADLLAGVADEVIGALPAPQHDALSVALLRANGPSDPRAIGTGFVSVLERLANTGPVLLAVDDLQWLDASSAAALRFALRRVDGPVLLLATERTDPPRAAGRDLQLRRPGQVTKLMVSPLGDGDVRRLLQERTGRRFSPAALRHIGEAAAGNPFMILEIARNLDPDVYQPTMDLPASLQEIVDSRLGSLDPSEREVVLYAATSARPRIPLIREALAGRDVSPSLEAAESAGIVILDGARISFSHPLLAAGTYAAASSGERRAAHQRIASLTEGEERARHLALAAISPDPEVIEALDEAAASAREKGASSNAAELLELGFRLGAEDPERRRRAAEHHLDAGNIPRARGLLGTLVEELPAGSNRARALGTLGTIHRLADDMPGSLALLEQAATETEERDRRIMFLLEVAFALTQSGQVAGALPRTDTAVSEAAGLGDPGLLAQALAVRTMVRFLAGEGLDEEAIERAVRLEDHRRRTPGVLRPTFIAGLLWSWTGRLEAAHRAIADVHEEYRNRGEESDLVHMTMHQGTLACARGDVAHGLRLVEDSLELAARLDSPTSRAVALENQVVVAGWIGEIDTARETAAEAFELFRRTRSPVGEFFTGAALGRVELSLGNHALAAQYLLPSARIAVAIGAGDPDTVQAVPDAIEALAALGRPDEAEELLAWQQERSQALGRSTQLAIAARCRGIIAAARGRLVEAQASLDQAIEHHHRLPVAFELARTRLALGHVQRRRRRRAAAAREFDEAEKILRGLGAEVWAQRAREGRDRIDATRSGDGGLTPAELRMAELAAVGLTNRTIAAQIFVSPKTVEATLSRVYRKLGIHSRAELGRSMVEREQTEARSAEHGERLRDGRRYRGRRDRLGHGESIATGGQGTTADAPGELRHMGS